MGLLRLRILDRQAIVIIREINSIDSKKAVAHDMFSGGWIAKKSGKK
jgi:hypothetical protein